VNWYANINTVLNVTDTDREVKNDIKPVFGSSPNTMKSDMLFGDTLAGLEDSKATIERIQKIYGYCFTVVSDECV
jgi:hypothetical protein